MLRKFYKIYAFLFARNIFRKLNMFLYQISLRGLGVLNYQGDYFVGEKAWLKGYLWNKKKPVVLDVGANIGSYSKFVLESNKEATVFAFEPHPKTYQKLASISRNKKFKAFNSGVGDKNGKLELYDYDTNDGSSHATLYQDVIKDLHKGNSISHVVEIIKLDDFILDQNLSKIDLLKIDTEGNEFKVLLGCLNTLKGRKIKAIHMEFNEMNIISKVSFKDFWDLLSDYKLYRILPGGKLLPIKNYSPIICEIYGFQNIVALLKDEC
jgi:FkbM family methyltransferase